MIEFLFDLDPDLAALLMTNPNLLKDITPPTGKSRVRAFDHQHIILPYHTYSVLEDCDLTLDVMAKDGQIIMNGITKGIQGDANDDGKVNIADIVEMVNEMDPNRQPSSKFKLKNADMNGDKKITQEDIDAVVDLILNKSN